MFHRHRVRADQELFEILNAGDGGSRFPFQSSLAPAVDALIGFDLDEDVRTIAFRGDWKRHAEGLDLCDTEARPEWEQRSCSHRRRSPLRSVDLERRLR